MRKSSTRAPPAASAAPIAARRSDADETAAASRAAHLGAVGPGFGREADERVDGECGDPRRELLPRVPLVGHRAPDRAPVGARQRLAHPRRGVANTVEAVDHDAVAIDVLLHDRPVVRTRIAWFPGVAEDQPLLQRGRVDVERDAAHAVDGELHGRDPAVQRRPVVLDARRHRDRLCLHVHGDLQQDVRLVVHAVPVGERRADGDGQRRGSRDPRPSGRLARGRQREAARLEEVAEQ